MKGGRCSGQLSFPPFISTWIHSGLDFVLENAVKWSAMKTALTAVGPMKTAGSPDLLKWFQIEFFVEIFRLFETMKNLGNSSHPVPEF